MSKDNFSHWEVQWKTFTEYTLMHKRKKERESETYDKLYLTQGKTRDNKYRL